MTTSQIGEQVQQDYLAVKIDMVNGTSASRPFTRGFSTLAEPLSPPSLNSESVLENIRVIQDGFQLLSLVMLTNYVFPKQATVQDCDEFDFIIAGGGTAGCVLANRLAAAKYTVLMLEAGSVVPFDAFLPGAIAYVSGSNSAWNFLAKDDNNTGKCHKNRGRIIPVGKVLGGSSSVGFMIVSRGIVNDFQIWAAAANDSSWEYRNLLPYFKRSEKLFAPKILNCPTGSCRGAGDRRGNIAVSQDNSTQIEDYLKLFAEMGNEIVQDLGGPHSVGYTRALLAMAYYYRQNTAFGYLTPAKKYPNLFVSMNTTVTKIVFDKQKNAIGVKASVNGEKEIFLKAKKEVLVSAGVIKSPQLLMLSGIGPRKHLEEKNITVVSDLPAGGNFQDPQVVTILHRAKKIVEPGTANLHDYPAALVFGYKSLEPCAGIPDYASFTFIQERLYNLLQYCANSFDYQNEICDSSYKQSLGRQLAYTFVVNLYPKSRGKIMLNTSNPDDAPLIDSAFFSEKEDIDNLIKYTKDFIGIANTTYFKKSNGGLIDSLGNKCDMFEYDSDDYWTCYVTCMSSTTWNYGGTCAMGSVVDAQLKVYGVKSLRVIDASVMPVVVTGGNLMATVVIAEKASDMIKNDHQRG